MKKIIAETAAGLFELDAANLRLCSIRSKSVPDQEFIAFDSTHPTFEIGYYDDKKRYRLLSSLSAQEIQTGNPAPGVHTAAFSGFTEKDLVVECRVTFSASDPFARFNISLDNRCGLQIADVHYPFVICPYKLNGAEMSETVVLPQYGSGQLLTGNLEYTLRPDSYHAWEFCPREGGFFHYPGTMFAQFAAYHNDQAGLYLACDDANANVKRFKILHRRPGIRLGVSHVGDWPVHGARELDYDVLLTTFKGDWYDAADIYRDWSEKQNWFIPLVKKNNIPDWLTDSPAYITIRSRGLLDWGDTHEIGEFIPYDEKCIPMLENLSNQINAPLCVVFMGWERAGPWVYPDCFPPVGGEESMKNAIAMIKERGWRAGSFCSGTRWCLDHAWNGYDGRDYLDALNAEEGYCQTADGSYWLDSWGADFRMSYLGCLGSEKTREMALGIVDHLVSWGMDALQFLDQNNGATTFACFADNHRHPAALGKWMHESMVSFIHDANGLAQKRGAGGVVHSSEAGVSEVCLPFFQQTELRVFPPGYGLGKGMASIPLYQYLFHECIVIQGMMGFGPEPYHLEIKNTANFIYGGIPGGVLTGDGTLLDKDTSNWALWEPKIGNNEDALSVIRNALIIRRGPGRDFLVFGRMLRPAHVDGIERVKWSFTGKECDYAAVFHSAWLAPDGRHAVVLANWTRLPRQVTVYDSRFNASELIIHSSEAADELAAHKADGVSVSVPPLGCVMITTERGVV